MIILFDFWYLIFNMYFDTHCHLNFKAFDVRVEEVISNAKKAGVSNIIIPGTDVPTSKKAVEIAE